MKEVRALLVAVIFASPLTAAQDDVVQLKDDPLRRLVLENGKVRVWEVLVPLGQASPFHEHKLDMVAVRINSTVITNVPIGGLFSFKSDIRLDSGSVSYAEYSKSPYVHRISPKGPNPHRVIEFELLAPPGESSAPGADRRGAETILDNPRIRASRLLVEPGQSADIAPWGNTLMVVVKGGPASQRSGAEASPVKELKPADIQWYAEPASRSIRNEGPSAMELVEVAVK